MLRRFVSRRSYFSSAVDFARCAVRACGSDSRSDSGSDASGPGPGPATVGASAFLMGTSSVSGGPSFPRCSAPGQPVYLKPSSSPFRKPSIYFAKSMDDVPSGVEAHYNLGTAAPLFKVTSPTCEYYAMRLPLVKAGFKRIADPSAPIDCNVLWGKSMPTGSVAPAASPSRLHRLQQQLDGDTELAMRMLTARERLLRHGRPWHRCQKINHFPAGHRNLGCKSGMHANLNAAAARAPREYDFYPKTWSLPLEDASMLEEISRAPAGARFIWKPARGSCGRGIFIFERDELLRSDGFAARALAALRERVSLRVASATADGESLHRRAVVVQEYIANPLLIDGRKCDMRLYVAVTSFEPLRVFLHSEGLVRFAAVPYDPHICVSELRGLGADALPGEASTATATATPAPSPLASTTGGSSARYGHLTNYSIGRRLQPLQQRTRPQSPGDEEEARIVDALELQQPLELKWSLQQFNQVLGEGSRVSGKSISVDKVWRDIGVLIVKTLLAARSKIVSAAASSAHAPHLGDAYFELFGFDVMLDETGKPWLVEVNTLPSLESSSAMDYAIKSSVTTDLFNLLQIELFDREPAAFTESGYVPPPPVLSPDVAMDARSLDAIVSSAAKLTPLFPAKGREGGFVPDESDPALIVDTICRATDEVKYAGGFRRIFPDPQLRHLLKLSDTPCSEVERALWHSIVQVPRDADEVAAEALGAAGAHSF